MEPVDGTKILPPFIFCPKCGKKIMLEIVKDPFRLQQIAQSGYDGAGKGSCVCGVEVGMLHRPMPETPTFEILVNVYATK